ncbi:MAG TPA: hypothetical protein VNT76_23325 [Candidatus Binatus sp.]|nr:hypothetical protein [Candidatus Binatus sp.]
MLSIDKNLAPIHFLTADSLNRIAKLLKQVAVKIERHSDKASYWQFIFMQSEANGCAYRGEGLPHTNWQWPRDTWFQEQRRHHLKDAQFLAHQARI